MQIPLVSVIVTCYNQAHCIESTLRSVIAQTYQNWECIIIDDGSTDSSGKVIESLIQSDNRFNYVKQVNAGVSSARNAGFALVKGEYINFLDGDDTIASTKIEKQIQQLIVRGDCYISICDHDHFDVSGQKKVYHRFEVLDTLPFNQILYGWHNGVSFPLHAALYKKQLWDTDELPFDKFYKGRAEDWIFNLRVAQKQKPYMFLNEVLCTYYHYTANFTADSIDSETAYLEAAIYIRNNMDFQDKELFFDKVLRQTLQRYADSKKIAFLKSSYSWRLGNLLTTPFSWLKKLLSI